MASERSLTCGDVRRYYLGEAFVRFLYPVLSKRSVVLCAAAEPVGSCQQCRPRLVAESPDALRRRLSEWLDDAFVDFGADDVPPVYPSLHYAVRRHWPGGRDWIFETDADEWQDAWAAIEPIVGLLAGLGVPYTLRYTGHCSPHVCLAEEDMPSCVGLSEALRFSAELARDIHWKLRRLVPDGSRACLDMPGPIARLPYTLNENTGLACIEIPPPRFGAFEPPWAHPDKAEPSSAWPPPTRSRRVQRLVEWAGGERAVEPVPMHLFVRASSEPTPAPVCRQPGLGGDFHRLLADLRRQVAPPECGATAPGAPRGMVHVPAGPFISCPSWPVADRPWLTRQLGRPLMSVLETNAYFIDVCPVTDAQYAEFVRDGGYERAEFWSEAGWEFVRACGWQGPSEPCREGQPDLPVRGVSCFEAAAYARWAGKRLPSLLEWEKACRGTDGRRWPWGDEFDETLCNTPDRHSSEDDWGPTPVGSLPLGASPYGCLDMVGNVWEWTEDAMVIGGSFASHLRRSNGCDYHGLEPHRRAYKYGFRCAADGTA